MTTCGSHQELRDMVIELRSDVKHIDQKISELVEVAKTNNTRIVTLETYNNQEIGRVKGVASIATNTSIVVSMVVSVLAIGVSWMVR